MHLTLPRGLTTPCMRNAIVLINRCSDIVTQQQACKSHQPITVQHITLTVTQKAERCMRESQHLAE